MTMPSWSLDVDHSGHFSGEGTPSPMNHRERLLARSRMQHLSAMLDLVKNDLSKTYCYVNTAVLYLHLHLRPVEVSC